MVLQERQMRKKEIIIECQSRRERNLGQDNDSGYQSGYRVHALEEGEDDSRTVLEKYWDEHLCTDDSIEVEALRKRDGDGASNGEDTKLCWQCNCPTVYHRNFHGRFV